MPRINNRGEMLMGCSGGGQGPLSINNTLVPTTRLVSCARWLEDDRIIYSTAGGTTIYNRATKTEQVVAPEVNWLEASAGYWYGRAQTSPPVIYGGGPQLGTYHEVNGPLQPRAAGGGMIYSIDYAKGGGLFRHGAEGGAELIPASVLIFRGDVAADGSSWAVRVGEGLINFSGVLIPVPRSADLAIVGPRYIVTWSHEHTALILIDSVKRTFVEITTGPAFWPHARLTPNGEIQIAYSVTAGEGPGHGQVRSFQPAALAWKALSEVVPTTPTPDTPQPPTNLRPHPHPLWIVPYHQITDRWGDSPNPIGNALLVVHEDEQEPISARIARASRAGALARPMVVHPSCFTQSIASLVVGLYLHCPTPAALRAEVAEIEAAIRNRLYPDVPLICYVDQPDAWDGPTSAAGLDPLRHWISPQCYRNGGEPLGTFQARISRGLTSLLNQQFQVLPTWHAYDRNGQGTVEEAVATFPLFITALHAHRNVRGILPFTDMRQGGGTGGMNLHPAIKAEVQKLVQMNPEDRPNRFSYWQPRTVSLPTVLRNKLGQARELVQLSKEEKDLLLLRL